jgi:hypothetical protein
MGVVSKNGMPSRCRHSIFQNASQTAEEKKYKDYMPCKYTKQIE